jgi:hypothetical protein
MAEGMTGGGSHVWLWVGLAGAALVAWLLLSGGSAAGGGGNTGTAALTAQGPTAAQASEVESQQAAAASGFSSLVAALTSINQNQSNNSTALSLENAQIGGSESLLAEEIPYYEDVLSQQRATAEHLAAIGANASTSNADVGALGSISIPTPFGNINL